MITDSTELLPVEDHIRVLLQGEAVDISLDDEDINIPPWYDAKKFKRGQRYIINNIFGQSIVTLSGLVCVLVIPSVLKVLMKTNKSSTHISAYRRYVSTILHVYSWYINDLVPDSVMWKSLMLVRKRHLRASRASALLGDRGVSQRDLALTQFGFFGLGLLKPHMVGMQHDNEEDIEAYVHMWRTIGYLIGIQDQFNLCRPSLEETMVVAQAMNDKVFRPLLCDPPQYFYHMITTLLDIMWYIDTTIDTKYYVFFVYRLVGVPGFHHSNNDKNANYANRFDSEYTFKIISNGQEKDDNNCTNEYQNCSNDNEKKDNKCSNDNEKKDNKCSNDNEKKDNNCSNDDRMKENNFSTDNEKKDSKCSNDNEKIFNNCSNDNEKKDNNCSNDNKKDNNRSKENDGNSCFEIKERGKICYNENEKDDYSNDNEIIPFALDQENILDGRRLYSSFNWFDRISLSFMIYITEDLVYTTLGRWYYNFTLRLSLCYMKYFPYLSIWKFGWKAAYVNIFEEDMSDRGELRENKDVLVKFYE